MKILSIVTIIAVVTSLPAVVLASDLTGTTIITEDAVRSGDGFPFDNTSFDPYLLAVDGTTCYFASVNVTTTYLDTQVFAFDIDADETATAAVEVVNDLALKSLYGGSGSFWFASSGDVATGLLYTITAEDGDGDDGEFIEPADIDRVIRVDLDSGAVANVIASTAADGVVGLTELEGLLYLVTSTLYGATENAVVTVAADASDGVVATLFGESEITAVTGGSAPQLCCIATTASGILLLADNETAQVLEIANLGGTPTMTTLVDSASLASTELGEVTITGLAALASGGFVVSDTEESADQADDRGVLAFHGNGLFDHVVATESQIAAIIPADDHLALTPNNEVRVSGDGRLVVCSPDNPESIYSLEDSSLLGLFRDGFETGTTSAWGTVVTD